MGSTAGALEQGPERRPSGRGSHQAPMFVPEIYAGKGVHARSFRKEEPRHPSQCSGPSIYSGISLTSHQLLFAISSVPVPGTLKLLLIHQLHSSRFSSKVSAFHARLL